MEYFISQDAVRPYIRGQGIFKANGFRAEVICGPNEGFRSEDLLFFHIARLFSEFGDELDLLIGVEILHFEGFGCPKINYPGTQIRCNDDILELQVPVDNSLRMNITETFQNLR